jgi:cell division septum initiation protein DivIVA
MSVRQDQFGDYVTGQLEDQQRMFDQRLRDMQAQSQQARSQMGSAYDARLADITASAGVQNQRLADITAAAGANQAALQAQQEAMARAGERQRIQEAYGDQSMPGVTGVQTKKRQNLGAYGGTGGGFNRSGLRIQNLNI